NPASAIRGFHCVCDGDRVSKGAHGFPHLSHWPAGAVLEWNKPRSRIGVPHADGTNRQSCIKAGQSVRLLRVNRVGPKQVAASYGMLTRCSKPFAASGVNTHNFRKE